jgi:hypothetical protein
VQLVQGDLAAAAGTFRDALRTPGIERAEITALLRSHLALTLLAGGDLPGAADLADDPSSSPSALAELEGLFLHGALALARGDTAELLSYADRLARRVEETTWWRFRRAAAGLAAAATAPPPLTALPRLLFILSAESTVDTV